MVDSFTRQVKTKYHKNFSYTKQCKCSKKRLQEANLCMVSTTTLILYLFYKIQEQSMMRKTRQDKGPIKQY